MTATVKTLRLILGDQLNAKHSWFKSRDDQTLYVIAELKQELAYVKHHVQKICAFFKAMGNFAEALEQSGHRVLHLSLDDTAHCITLPELINELHDRWQFERFEYLAPDEYRLRHQLAQLQKTDKFDVHCQDTEHFLFSNTDIDENFAKNKAHRMEFFYRKMRKRYGILMAGDNPVGGKWNFDASNRDKLKPEDMHLIRAPVEFANPVDDILERLDRHQVHCFGEAASLLNWPVNRRQASELLEYFCAHLLKNFGRFQDAMVCEQEHGWSLFHSRLSFALNSKMLHPLDVIQRAVQAFEASEDIGIAQIEGFVRQILGWREFIRAIYWANMPEFAKKNALHANRDLPQFFWDGNTRMKCLSEAIGQSLKFAYAHHIQRLMVTGNFCLLAGIDPDQVDAWYLGIYADAIQWVELPNTRGMSQFADGGITASKPYIASGQYIHKMSNYCEHCRYNVKAKTTHDACPLNSLYWRFVADNLTRLKSNPRTQFFAKTWERFDADTKKAYKARSNWCLDNLEAL